MSDDFSRESEETAVSRERLRSLIERALDTAETSDSDVTGAVTSEERRHLADQQFLHALLERVHQPGSDNDEQRIQQAMALLRATPAGEQPRRVRRSWAGSALAALAVVLLIGFAALLMQPTPTAAAALQQALSAALMQQDRVYAVTSQVRHPLRGQTNVSSTLYVRGGDKFALNHPAPLGPGTIWVGSDGSDVWFVPRLGPVVVDREGKLLDRLMNRRELSTPYLQVTTILQRLGDRYDLKLLPLEEIPAQSESGKAVVCRHLRGKIKPDAGNGEALFSLPETIELWAERDSGVAQRLVLTWPAGTERIGPERIELELSETPTLRGDWYEHAAHHSPNRPVLQNGAERDVEEPAVMRRGI